MKHQLTKSLAIALFGWFMTTWTMPALAYDFVTADSLRFLYSESHDAVFLTYASVDSLNASAYTGQLTVPSMVLTETSEQFPVKGVTAMACAFCDQLQSVTLSEGIESVGFCAFTDCAALEQITLPASLTTLSDFSFSRASHLQEVSVPAGVKRIGDGAFGFCYALNELTIAEGVQRIAPHAFYHCSSLEQIDLPASVSQLGQYAFSYCTSLRRIEVHASPLAITEDVFEGVDRSHCRLIVPTNLIDLYKETPVWQDFRIMDSEMEQGIDLVLEDDPELMQVYVIGDQLHVCVLGDAPALVYDMQGHRLAVCASGSGDNALTLPQGRPYLIRCGRVSRKIWLQ